MEGALDMTQAPAAPVAPAQPTEDPKNAVFNLTLTQEEIDTIKNALAESKNFEAFVRTKKGEVENKLLLDLESI